MLITTITVLGDSDTQYTITIDEQTGRARCQCPAYRFSLDGECKHIRFVDRALAGYGAAS